MVHGQLAPGVGSVRRLIVASQFYEASLRGQQQCNPEIARDATLRQIFDELQGESQRIMQEALGENERTIPRDLACYLLVVITLLTAIAFYISRMQPSAALPA